MAARTFSLPSMSRLEIISFLTEFQIITLSNSDLENPTPDFVFNLYISLLQHINTFQDDTSQLDFERLGNPDMNVDSARLLNLLVQIQHVLESIECPTAFTLTDLIHPDSNRITTFLSALINFSLQRHSRLSMVTSYSDQFDLLEEQRKQTKSQNLQLKEEIEAFKAVEGRERLFVQEPEAKVMELRQGIDNLNSLLSNWRKEHQAINRKAQELTNSASQKMTKLLAQMHTIEEQVNSVKSVGKFVKQLKAKLSDEKMMGISLEAKVTECEAKAEKLDKEKREPEKEKNLSRDKDTRGLNDVKLEAESRRKDLVARRKKIEATVAQADAVKFKIKSMNKSEAATPLELLRKSGEIVNQLSCKIRLPYSY